MLNLPYKKANEQIKTLVLLYLTSTSRHSKVESAGVTVTSAKPSAASATVGADESLKKDIPIPAKNLTAEAEGPITSVVKNDDVRAEIESKLLRLPPRFNITKSDEDRKSMSVVLKSMSFLLFFFIIFFSLPTIFLFGTVYCFAKDENLSNFGSLFSVLREIAASFSSRVSFLSHTAS